MQTLHRCSSRARTAPASYRSYAAVPALIIIAITAAVLLGWKYNILALNSVFPSLPTMKANTAVALLLCGFCLVLLSVKPPNSGKNLATRSATGFVVMLFSCAVFLIGALTSLEYLFGWNFGIDQALFVVDVTGFAQAFARGMSPASCLSVAMV